MGDVVLNFRGAEYRIPESRLFEVGEKIEDVAPLFEITSWQTSPHFHKMARCLGLMLRAAGAKATDKEVYGELLKSVKAGGRDGYMGGALYALIGALFDGAPADDEGGEPGEPQPAS